MAPCTEDSQCSHHQHPWVLVAPDPPWVLLALNVAKHAYKGTYAHTLNVSFLYLKPTSFI